MSIARRQVSAVLGLLGLTATALAVAAAPAAADGPTTFSNSAAIAVPAGSSSDGSGNASPYPSPVSVSGLTGAVSNVTATLNNLTHGSAGDVDVLLVAPDGSNLVLMSDRGDATSFTFASNATLTFSDAAAGQLPDVGLIGSGTYKPSDADPGGAPDSFPGPAPSPSGATTLAGAFTGIDPNGTWNLYVVDDVSGDTGSIAGGWSVTVTTTTAAASTTTTVGASPNPASTSDTVTLTATVTSSGSPVTSGSVSFSDNGSTLGSDTLDGAGHATFDASGLSEGSHQIVATFSGTPDFLTSNGSTTAVVDTPTTVTGSTFCNEGGITVPTSGLSTPYASHITVSGEGAILASVTAELRNVDHSVPTDLDVLLVGPGGQAVTLLSDVGGSSAVNDVDLTFDDTGSPLAGAMASGTYSPTDDDVDGADPFPAPAPPATGTAMSDFEASSPNGTWSLYVVDDASGDAGRIDAWCLNVSSKTPTTSVMTVQPVEGPVGTSELLTATVTDDIGNPVPGRVTFYDVTGGVVVPLGNRNLDGAGQATLTTSSLPAGRRLLRFRYKANDDYAKSWSPHVSVKVRPIADANGPYVVVRNNPLTLSAAGSTVEAGTTLKWDLNGDGDYTDAQGVSPTLTWADLQSLGIQAGRSYRIALRVTSGGVTTFDHATLKIRWHA